MSLRRLLGLLLAGSSIACTAPERSFVPDDGGTDGNITNGDCTGRADGTECGPAQICLKGACKSSSCGDGFINKSTEDCEDGNDQSGDGCSACKFDCRVDVDCKSDNICLNSTCDVSDPTKHICKGTPASDGTSCATVKDIDGTCKAGVCRKIGCGDGTRSGTEECDDGNAEDSDGCKSDCTFTCKADVDCDDMDACTGKETCDTSTHTCAAGTAVVCTTTGSCSGTCDKMSGVCEYPDVDKDGAGCDKDCNDADPAMFPGAFECKDGKDNDCNAATPDGTAPSCLCYVDSDKDGYAVSGASSVVSTAACPDAHTRRAPVAADPKSLDCKEGVASVFPGQSAYFTASYCSGLFKFDPFTMKPTCTASSYDYDCDGVVSKQYNSTSTVCSRACLKGGLCFCVGAGWSGTTVPECGATASFRSCTLSGTLCVPSIANRQQACK